MIDPVIVGIARRLCELDSNPRNPDSIVLTDKGPVPAWTTKVEAAKAIRLEVRNQENRSRHARVQDRRAAKARPRPRKGSTG